MLGATADKRIGYVSGLHVPTFLSVNSCRQEYALRRHSWTGGVVLAMPLTGLLLSPSIWVKDFMAFCGTFPVVLNHWALSISQQRHLGGLPGR